MWRPYSIRNLGITCEVNIAGTMNLLEACLRSNVARFIYVSTCAVYGEAEYLPIDERHPTNLVSPYAESKLAAEQCCKKFLEAQGLKITILGVFNAYGSRMRDDHYGGVIARFIRRLRDGRPPIIYGDGMQTRDFVHMEDVVRAMTLALNNGNAVGRTFNVGTGVPMTVNQLALLLMHMFGIEGIRPRYLRARQGDVKHSYAGIREARDALGYELGASLEEGLSTLIG